MIRPFFLCHACVPQIAIVALLLCQPVPSLGQSSRLQHGLSPTYGTPAAPDLDLSGLDGNRYRLSGYRGKVLIINFWASWCPPCLAEMPTLQKAWDLLHDGNFEILAVNLGESEETIRRFVNGHKPKLGFPLLIATDQSIMQTWRIQGLPTSHIVDTWGRLVYSEVGPRDFSHEHIIARLRALMAGPVEDAGPGFEQTGSDRSYHTHHAGFDVFRDVVVEHPASGVVRN